MKKIALLLFCMLVTLIICSIFASNIPAKHYFTIEKSTDSEWELSETNFPDTTITDTIKIDGVISYRPIQYLRVLKK